MRYCSIFQITGLQILSIEKFYQSRTIIKMDDDTNCSYLAREELMLLESMYNPDELQVIRALDTYEATQVILKQVSQFHFHSKQLLFNH